MNQTRTTRILPLGSFPAYKYVVVFSRIGDKWLFSRHRARTTWETQGGHIEAGETPLQAAKRELYEESGAVLFDIVPVCDYWAGDRASGAAGVVFFARIEKLGPLPRSEMAQVCAFDALPQAVTYPAITPLLFAHVKALGEKEEKSPEWEEKAREST